jgi:hypothetical protein
MKAVPLRDVALRVGMAVVRRPGGLGTTILTRNDRSGAGTGLKTTL